MPNKLTLETPAALDWENVIPRYSKIPAQSFLALAETNIFDPSSLNIHKAAGGFNSVFEISAQCCLRVLESSLDLQEFRIVVPAASFQSFVSAQSVFQSVQLNRIRSEHYPGNYVIRIVFQPSDLKFIDTKYAIIRFIAYVELHEPLHLATLASTQTPPTPRTTVRNEISRLSTAQNMAFIATVPSWTDYFEIEIKCEYGHETDDALKRADVFVRLGTASLTYNVRPGDMKVLFDNFVVPQQANINQVFVNKSKTPICPTISLAGVNPSNITFDEVTSFDVEVFPVGIAPKQVLALAFNLKQGCHGIDEFVSNFIGDNDYGIISDEYLVERILKYRWRLGGFRRTLRKL